MLKNSLNNYVISSRIRLARNVENFKFPSLNDAAGSDKIIELVSAPFLNDKNFKLFRLKNIPDIDVISLKEKHLISNTLIENRQAGAALIDSDGCVSIMINEEDHIRLQVILDGLELSKAFKAANGYDDLIAKNVPIAFDKRLGYMTSCPTNLGTGMRASVMMFLPALILNNTISSITNSVTMSKMTFRGVYGEGSNAEGFMYQLSNQHTLGLSENEIIDNVTLCVNKIAAAEENARQNIYNHNKTKLTDRIMRGWGLLCSSYTMSSSEFMEHISYVKLGVGLGLIKLAHPEQIDKLIISCQPGNFASIIGAVSDAEIRDIKRAEYLSKEMQKLGRI